MKDLKNNLGSVLLQTPADIGAVDAYSNLLDLQGFESAQITVLVGLVTGGDGTNKLDFVIQESDTTATGTFTAVASTDLMGSFTQNAGTDNYRESVGYVGAKRYIRVKFDFTTPGGGAAISAAIVGVLGLLGNPRVYPVVSPAAVAAT
jgi:hypothetical protein